MYESEKISSIRLEYFSFCRNSTVIVKLRNLNFILFIAIVEFLEPSEARKAFTCLAYTKFKNVPLYLEWAPENSLTERKEPLQSKNEESENKIEEVKEEINEKEEIEEECEPDTTLFVKNLNFQTTDEELRKVCCLIRLSLKQ